MEVIKASSLKGQLRTSRRPVSPLISKISQLNSGEALLISAKEADQWKVPASCIRSLIQNGYKRKELSKSVIYSVNNLKSGSYAVVRIN